MYVAAFSTKYDKLKFHAHSVFKKNVCLVATVAVGLLKEKSASHPTSLFMCKVSAPSVRNFTFFPTSGKACEASVLGSLSFTDS